MNFLKKWFRYSTIGPALIRFYLAPHVKLHYIHTSDAEFHNHPWSGFSIIFGSYQEITNVNGEITVHNRRIFNYISYNKIHKVLIKKPVWTLFINGKRTNEKWFYGEKQKPWEGSDQERVTV